MSSPKQNILSATKLPSLMLIAIVLNIAIFILIQQLVSKEHSVNSTLTNINLVEFIRLDKKPEPPKPKQEIEEIQPPPLEQEPPPPEIFEPQIKNVQAMRMNLPLPRINMPSSLSGTPYLGDSMKSMGSGRPKFDSNVVPTLRVPPLYPMRALRSGIEGVVTVEFTIAVDGSVKNTVIVKSTPPEIFDSAVLKAITKWKYAPDIVNGKPVEKRARQDVKFKLKR